MDGSEPVDTVPAAVLSGAPTDLQARTVRYGYKDTNYVILRRSNVANHNAPQNLPPLKAGDSVRRLAQSPMENGLGYLAEGSPVGEPSYRLAVVCRRHAGHQFEFQDQGGCHPVCAEAGI